MTFFVSHRSKIMPISSVPSSSSGGCDLGCSWKDRLRYVFAVSCIVGCFTHSIFLFTDFVKFQTVVTVTVKKRDYVDMPSVTICAPIFLKRKLEAKYSDLRKELNEMNVVSGRTELNESNEDQKDPTASSWDHTYALYEKYARRAMSESTYKELFELGPEVADIVRKCQLRKWNGRKYAKHPCSDEWEVMESLTIKRKCFTFFSQLNNDLRRLKIPIEPDTGDIRPKPILKFELAFSEAKNIYAYAVDKSRPLLSVHPPRMIIPGGVRTLKFEPGNYYITTFSRLIFKYLQLPFDTACHRYPKGDVRQPQSREECINLRIINLYRDVLNCSYLDSDIAVRKYIIEMAEFSKLPVCNLSESQQDLMARERINARNEDHCHRDCRSEFYEIDSKAMMNIPVTFFRKNTTESWKGLLEYNKHFLTITLYHKPLGDFVYAHTPKTPLFELLCLVGGVGSLWLGLSLLSFYDFFSKLFRAVYHLVRPRRQTFKPKTELNPNGVAAPANNNNVVSRHSLSMFNQMSTYSTSQDYS